MDTHEMMERFRQFASADLSFTTPNRMHQISEVLLSTSVVRIILTRYEDKAEDIEVDVEVSLPPLPESSDIVLLQGFIDTMIETLEYLKHLIFIGFGLDLVQEEGILVVSGNLSKDTEEHMFEVLRPPH